MQFFHLSIDKIYILQELLQTSFETNITKNKKTNKITEDRKPNVQEKKIQTLKTPVSKKAVQDSKELKTKDDSKPGSIQS